MAGPKQCRAEVGREREIHFLINICLQGSCYGHGSRGIVTMRGDLQREPVSD
jgi:hypothetical protein